MGSSLKRVSPLVVAVTSGKGGVGKTLTTVNLAVAARRSGKSVLILDGDLGLANVDVVLGLTARYNIRDVLDGHAALKDIVVQGPLGIDLIPSGSGIANLTRLSMGQEQRLLDEVLGVDHAYDLLLIDTGAGIARNVALFCGVADQVVVVTTPEPHAMTDAYALIKVMAEDHRVSNFQLLVNQARSTAEGLKVAERIAEVAKRFLDIDINHLGIVPLDPQVPKSVLQRRAASEQSTHTLAGQAWSEAARQLLTESGRRPQQHADVQGFWRHLVQESSELGRRAAI